MDSRLNPPYPLAAEPRFDVFIRLPRGMSPEEAQQRVEQAGLTPAQGASICAALHQVPVVQVRKGIDEQRARKTEHQLSLAGLKVEVKRVSTAPRAASSAPVIPDASYESADMTALAVGAPAPSPIAPPPVMPPPVMHFAAAAPVAPPPSPPAPAAAPAPTPPMAERRASPPPPERQRVEDPEDFEFNLEAGPGEDDDTLFSPPTTRPATQPPSTLPPPMGRTPAPARAAPRRLAPLLWGVALVAVGAAAFVLGRLSLPWLASAETQVNTTQSIDKVLVAVGAPPALAEVSASSASAALLGTADESGSGAADSLTQLAKAERAQGRGVTLEQAVAQMQGAKVGAGLLLPGDQLPAKLAQAAASPTSAGPSATGAANNGAALLPAALRATLTADMAVQLAEFGQSGRAREVLGRLRSDALLSGDPAVSGSTQRAEVLLLAWSLREANGPAIDRNIASLRSLVHGIESPVARAALMGSVATVLAKHDNIPDALALACLADAGEALKSVSDGGQRQAAIDDWLVDTGDLLLSQLARHGRLGRWQQAQSLAGQLDTLAGQARSGHAVLQLQALRARAQDLMGQPSRAEKLLADALKTWAQNGSPARQAEELRALASRAGDIAQPELFQVTAQLATAADALHGADRARALTSLALMQAEAGEAERFEALKAMLRQSTEAARPEQAGLTAQLLVGGELAAARAEQRSGAFGLAEARVRKVAAYLL